jgi:hypothetical protein
VGGLGSKAPVRDLIRRDSAGLSPDSLLSTYRAMPSQQERPPQEGNKNGWDGPCTKYSLHGIPDDTLSAYTLNMNGRRRMVTRTGRGLSGHVTYRVRVWPPWRP